MDIDICGGGKMKLADGTLATLIDTSGNVLTSLQVSGNCWVEVEKATKAGIDPNNEPYFVSETSTTRVPAACDSSQVLKMQGVRICRNQSGNIIKCPPR